MEPHRLFPRLRTSAELRRITLETDALHYRRAARNHHRNTTKPVVERPRAQPRRPRRPPVPPKLNQLPLSNPQRGDRSRVPRVAASLAFHASLIYAATLATMNRDGPSASGSTDTTLVYLTSQPNTPQPQPIQPKPPPVVAAIAPPKGFQTLTAPIDVPTDIPPIDLTEKFDPRDYWGVGVEGGSFDGVDGATETTDAAGIFAAAAVEELPEWLGGPPLRFPSIMRRAGAGGSVVAEFVVDTTGAVEQGTLRFVSSSHEAFESSARATILGSRFRPGRMRGRKVRVLVQQRFDFTLVASGR